MLSCKKFCQFLLTFPPYQAETLRIFQGCFTVQLSRLFFVVSSDNFYILSQSFAFVNNFLKLFIFLSNSIVFNLFCSTSLIILSLFHFFVNTFLKLFLFLSVDRISRNGEGGIWTLAPLLTTCTLSRGVPSTSWVLLQIVDSDNLYNDRRHECLAERVGFEPTRPFGQTVFKTASLWPLRYLSECVSISLSSLMFAWRQKLF